MTPFERDYVALMQAALDAPDGLEAHRQADAALVTLVQEMAGQADGWLEDRVGRPEPGDYAVPIVTQTLALYHPAVARDTKAVVFHVVVGEGIEEALTPEKAREIAEQARGLLKAQVRAEVEQELKNAAQKVS